MKNIIKLMLVSSLTIGLSACIATEDDRVREHGSKCEMYGFMPGTDQFARCVQKRENRYEASQFERDQLHVERERNRLMRDDMEYRSERRHRHHIERKHDRAHRSAAERHQLHQQEIQRQRHIQRQNRLREEAAKRRHGFTKPAGVGYRQVTPAATPAGIGTVAPAPAASTPAGIGTRAN